MISANKAYELIMEHLGDWGSESIPFEQSVGRVMVENINADRDFPPFNRVTMDGIGIAFKEGVDRFKVVDLQAAGMPQKSLEDSSTCMEVMTGAICPIGIDTVIPYENFDIIDGVAHIHTPVGQGKNIHPKGFDKTEGDSLLLKGSFVSTAEIGVLATVGKSKVEVAKLPKVAIVSTGDELVDVDSNPETHQIRKSNVWALKADLIQLGIDAKLFHLLDSKAGIKSTIENILSHFDVVLLSGGVSKGKLDYIPEILTELGVEKVFHRVKQRPGKPFWFGSYKNKVQFFAFPGNPVSTYSNFHRYFVPWLNASLGKTYQAPFKMRLSDVFEFGLPLTYFLQVKIIETKEGLKAKPMKGKGSGDLANLLETDGFMIIPEEVNHCSINDEFDYIPFRNIGL